MDTAHETARDLHEAGFIDKRRMGEYDEQCLSPEMKTNQLRKWDSAERLKTDEDMALYLEACMEEAGDDPAFITKALGTIARAKGMTELAHQTEGDPSFATVLKVISALGIKLHVKPTHP